MILLGQGGDEIFSGYSYGVDTAHKYDLNKKKSKKFNINQINLTKDGSRLLILKKF